MSQPVSVQTTAGIAVITVDAPPRNVLSASVRRALFEVIHRATASQRTKALLLVARGKNYIAGPDPDVQEDDGDAPSIGELAAQIEACTKPVVTALQGHVTGPGFEIALAAHYRLADHRAKFALPEIRFGLLPQAGATQRLPRVIAIDHAVELLVSGRPIDADAAKRIRLVDAVAKGPLPRFSVDWIKERLAKKLPPRRASDKPKPRVPADFDQDLIKKIRAAEKKRSNNPAIPKLLDCIEASLTVKFDAAIEMEREAYKSTLASKYSVAMRHVIRAEGRAAIPPTERAAAPAKLKRIGVIGAGRIGRGVVAACLDAGYPVTMVEQNIDRLEEAVEAVIDIYDRDIANERLDAATRDKRVAQLSGTTDPGALSNADLVIEALPDDAQAKRQIFAQIDPIMKRDAILATTTSGLDLDGLAAGTGRAERIVGLHFFPPSYQMRTVEVVLGVETSDKTVATAFDLVTQLRKLPVASAVSDGYLAHRMASALIDSALVLLVQGHEIEVIDAAMEWYGFALGPFKLADAIGLDVLADLQKPHASKPGVKIRTVLSRMVEAGRTGRRAGSGFYRYAPGVAEPEFTPDVMRLFQDQIKGPGKLKRPEMVRRTLAALANQGAFLLHGGIARRPSDLDVLMIQVFGFPRRRGGPMLAAEQTGALRVKRDLQQFTAEAPELWTPAPLWTELMNSNETLGGMNR